MNDKAAIERGDILSTQGNYEEAKRMFEFAYNIQVNKYGTQDNEEIFATRINIAETCAQLEQFEEALNIYQDVRAKAKKLGLQDIVFFCRLEFSFAVQMKDSNQMYLSTEGYNYIEQYFGYYEEILERLSNTITFAEDFGSVEVIFLRLMKDFVHPNITLLRIGLLIVHAFNLVGHYKRSLPYCDTIYQKCLIFPGPSHPLTLLSCLDTAKTLKGLFSFEKAHAILRNYSKKMRQCPNLKKEGYIEAVRKIDCEHGNISYVDGHYNAAKNYFKLVHDSDLHELSDILSLYAERMKGKIRFKLGDYQNALVTLKRVFQEQVRRSEYRDLLLTMNDIAEIMEEEFQYNRAMDMYKSMCQMSVCTLSDLIYIENKVAIIHTKMHEVEDAVTKFKILMVKCKEMSCSSRHLTSIQNGLAMAYCQQGKYDDAINIYKDIIKDRENYLSYYHADILDAAHNLARAFEMVNRPQEARDIYEQIRDLRRAIFHPFHRDCLAINQSIAEILEKQNGYEEAFRIYCDVYDTVTNFYDTDCSKSSEVKEKMRLIAKKIKVQPRLITATKENDLQKIRDFLEKGDYVNIRDNIGSTPLHIACRKNSSRAVLILLKFGANYEIQNWNSKTPLDIAASSPLITEVLEQVRSVFERVKGIQEEEMSNIIRQVQTSERLEAIFNAKDNEGFTPLHWASMTLIMEREDFTKIINIVKCLLGNGADIKSVTKKRYLALHFAAKTYNRGIFEILLDHLYKNNSNEFTEILNSVENDEGLALLHIAALNNLMDTADHLLKRGANPVVRNKLLGEFPIHLARDNEVKRLLEDAASTWTKPDVIEFDAFRILKIPK